MLQPARLVLVVLEILAGVVAGFLGHPGQCPEQEHDPQHAEDSEENRMHGEDNTIQVRDSSR